MSHVLASSILDSHLHLWDRSKLTYDWLDGVGIDGPYEPHHVPGELAGAPLDGYIFVQAECDPSQAMDEVRWVNSLASKSNSNALKGIVAHVDHTSPSIADDLDQIADLDNVLGVRQLIQGQPAGFARSLCDGISHLAARNLTFDLCCAHTQLDEVIELVARCATSTRFVLDHLGKPPVGDLESFTGWADRITDLASAPNVFCKLSGLQTELAAGVSSDPEHYEPCLAHAIDAFTIDRVMYGSDWPVCTLNGSMQTWVAVVASILGDDVEAHQKVFHDNAQYFYRTQLNASQAGLSSDAGD